jgi:hypothetical protein
MGNVKKLSKRGKYWQETPKGMEIPVPKRGDVLRDLRKAASPPDRPELDRDSEDRQE